MVELRVIPPEDFRALDDVWTDGVAFPAMIPAEGAGLRSRDLSIDPLQQRILRE